MGSGMGPACGAAFAAKRRKKDWVAAATFGEGQANAGIFHESLNIASLWKLPVVYISEDNRWAISVAKSKSTSVQRNSDRAAAYGIPGYFVEGNDLLKIYEVCGKAIADARAGKGPSLIEVETHRFMGHFEGDSQVYRPKDEAERLRKRDQIKVIAEQLIQEGIKNEDLDKIREAAKVEIEDAFEFGRKSPFPEPEEALQDLFAE